MDKASLSRLRRKTLEAQFVWELEHGFELSPKEAEGILLSAQTILCGDGRSGVGPGQVSVVAVGMEESASKSLDQMRKVEVVVTLEGGQGDLEVADRYGGEWCRCIRVLRMTEEAIDQGGVLTQEDLGRVLGVDVRTIRRDIRRLREAGYVVNTRGYYRDIGKGVSHKAQIVGLYLEGLTHAELMRKTRHSLGSIKQYISTFGRVVSALLQGIEEIGELAYVVGISGKLAGEYVGLYERYREQEGAQEELAHLIRFNEVPLYESADRRERGGPR